MIALPRLINRIPEAMLRKLGPCSPDKAGAVTFRTFCTPHLSRHRSPGHDLLVERARFYLRDAVHVRVATSEGEVQAYVIEPERGGSQASVLLVHDWTDEASFMSAFAEHCRKRGFRTVLLDCPAHGGSIGSQTSIIAGAHAVRE